MFTESKTIDQHAVHALRSAPLPRLASREDFNTQLDALRDREKEHTRRGDEIAAERRRLPMVEVAATTTLMSATGPVTLLDCFDGRKQLIAYYFMWHAGRPAAEQCPGCTWVTSHMGELSYFHGRDATFAVFAQGPYAETARYREFMGWHMPWYSATGSALETLLCGRRVGRMHLVCYVRDEGRVFETYWTTSRGVDVMDNSYRLLDLTVYGRQESHEVSPPGWPQPYTPGQLSVDGRPLSQWSRVEAGRSDDLLKDGKA